MAAISLFNVLDWTSGLGRKFRRKSGEPSNVKEEIIVKSAEEYENLVGRFDVTDRVRSRELDVPEADRDFALECGAVWDENAQVFKVPDGRSEDEFQEWWPKVPEDLRDTQSRIITTKLGRRAEGFLQGNDMGQGGDSLATPLMYLAFPVIGVLATFLVSLIGWAGWAALLLTIPYFIALKQGEGMKESLKALVLLQWVPMALQFMVGDSKGGTEVAMQAGGMAVYAQMAKTYLWWAFGLVGVLFVVCFVAAASHPHRGVIGGTAARFIQAMKWVGLIFAALVVAKVLPFGLGEAAPYVLACMYAMQYAEGNFVQNAARLYLQNNDNNLATQGALINSHVKAREQQAEAALRDKTPLITIGRATGHLSDKGYGYSPDLGTVMMFSWRDCQQGLLVFGAIGSGKSYAALRPIARRFRKAALAMACVASEQGDVRERLTRQKLAGGALIADGKDGAIIADLEGLFDIVVKPGMRVGPYEGLAPDQIVRALRGASGGRVDEKSKLWTDGGDAFLYHTGIILRALVDHEMAYRSWCSAKLEGLERAQLDAELELVKQRKLDEDVAETEALLERVAEQIAIHRIPVSDDRQWQYTPFHHAKLLSIVERVIPASPAPRANAKLMEVVKYLGLEEADTSHDEEGRLAYAAYLQQHRLRQHNAPETIHPDLFRPMSQLQSSLNWALKEIPDMHPDQRQSFTLNSRGLLEKLLRGEKLRDSRTDMPWHSIEEGEVDVSDALYGAMVGLFLPPTQFGEAGEMMMRLLKQRVMNGIKARGAYGDKWRETLPGQTEVMLMLDEAHLLLTTDDINLFSISRSLGLMPVLATQGFESLVNAFGSVNEADLMANTMQSVIALKCSHNTHEYLEKRFGQATLTTFKQRTRGIDYQGGMNNWRHSVLNDPDHAYASAYDKMRMEGAGRLTASRIDAVTGRRWRIGSEDTLGQDEIARDIDMPTGGKREVQPLFLQEEYSALLEPRGHAIVALNRAGIKRIDLAELLPDAD
ncbi:TraM recognition domain-containing protein [Stenotrophomonas maltophilia]|uniref:TraM recognition domain-containing protein n=2 Tax=Stenotrophomonas maltophilia TaxID=40324 RepID=UPI0012AF3648|nr:TraM recognition domain-containing protein [Stenotrophomonas maltophilia]EMB2829688.1 TraM recognition domain-containing protein [Stenotrophomonas maltophilia]MBH1539552.1 TraM recognition domain-containing protein [Stenotrophomonas maltophilia]MBN5153752.1 TraM recognition domain-containing protein [Stenotrophomonas maltophilia]MBN5188847.1 TraM recognition domain-containing protein [Stenotrophomonas maltophilia]MDG2506681.1 TraM recognition domain-containing protein [Stenotrophomonas malt